MRAAQVMSPGVLSVSADASVFDAAELLVGSGVSAMPVVNEAGRIVGIVSEADLMRRPEIGTEPHKSWLRRFFADDATAAAEYVSLHSRRVSDVMTKHVVTVLEDAPLGEVAEVMAKHKIKRVPVLRGDVIVGVVSRANVVQALLSRDPKSPASAPTDDRLRRDVQAAVTGQPWTSPWPVNIVVNAGVVHLWGFVPSEQASAAYRVAAENVAGVKKVKNHMRRMPAAVGMGI